MHAAGKGGEEVFPSAPEVGKGEQLEKRDRPSGGPRAPRGGLRLGEGRGWDWARLGRVGD